MHQVAHGPWRRSACPPVAPACRLQSLDARRFLVVHDKGPVIKLRDAGVELAQELEHEGLVGLLLLLVEPAGLIVRVKLVVGRMQFANLVVRACRAASLSITGMSVRVSPSMNSPFHNGPARKSSEILRVLVVMPFRPMSSSTCGVARTRNG